MKVGGTLRRVLMGLDFRASAESGQALTEYALLLALIALIAFGAVNEFGLGVSQLYSKVVANFP